RDKVEAMAKALLELETIDAEQIQDIMDGRPPRPPKPTQAPQQPPQAGAPGAPEPRSEEHTSELQSRVDLVCRLLLEKTKKTKRGDPANARRPVPARDHAPRTAHARRFCARVAFL